jgi:mRNA capping enzyme, C-terminal domain
MHVLYSECLQEAESECRNENPDPEAPSDSPLMTKATREPCVQIAFKKFIEKLPSITEDTLECSGWVFHRVRDDKNEANFIQVAMNTWISIQQSVSQEDLIQVCEGLKEKQLQVDGKRQGAYDQSEGAAEKRMRKF